MTPTPPYKVVPVEPTDEMKLAGRKAVAAVANKMEGAKLVATSAIDFWQRVGHNPEREIWDAMLSASPALAPTDEACLPPLPEWCKQDNLGGLVPSEIRHALCNYARDAVALNGVAQTDEAIARAFHEAYERLAPSFGYSTREETRAFDANSANGKLMIAVCGEVRALLSRSPKVDADEEQSHG